MVSFVVVVACDNVDSLVGSTRLWKISEPTRQSIRLDPKNIVHEPARFISEEYCTRFDSARKTSCFIRLDSKEWRTHTGSARNSIVLALARLDGVSRLNRFVSKECRTRSSSISKSIIFHPVQLERMTNSFRLDSARNSIYSIWLDSVRKTIILDLARLRRVSYLIWLDSARNSILVDPVRLSSNWFPIESARH